MAPSPDSPFFAAGIITDSRYFVGRQHELDFLFTRMRQAISVNVVGDRKVGKSCLLYHVLRTYEQRVPTTEQGQNVVVAYISLREARCRREVDFYKTVAEELESIPKVQRQAGLREVLERENPDRAGFQRAILQWQRQNFLPVICLDEIEALFENPQEFDSGFFDNLRTLMERSALMLIITSLRPVGTYSKKRKFTSAPFNPVKTLVLQDLTNSESIDLVRLPKGEPLLSEEEQKLALEWGERHAYKLQLAGSYLVDARRNGRGFEWAKKQFYGEVGKKIPAQNWKNIKPLWLLYRFVCLIGNLTKVGSQMSELADFVKGLVVIVLIVLLITGYLNRSEVIEWFKEQVFGG